MRNQSLVCLSLASLHPVSTVSRSTWSGSENWVKSYCTNLMWTKRKCKRCFELSIAWPALSHMLVIFIHCCKLALEVLLCVGFDNHLSSTANLGWKQFFLWQLSVAQNEARHTLPKTSPGERCKVPLYCALFMRHSLPLPPLASLFLPLLWYLPTAFCL